MKKHLAIFSAILMVMLCVTCINPVSAATPAYDVELFPNGNCDTTIVGTDGVTRVQGFAGGCGVADSDVKRGETGYSVKLSFATDTGNYTNQRADFLLTGMDVSVGGYTEITGYINISKLGTGSTVVAAIQKSYKATTTYPSYDIGMRQVFSATTDGFIPFTLTTSDVSVVNVYICFYICGTGTINVDDVSVKNRQGFLPASPENYDWNACKTYAGASAYYGVKGTNFYNATEAAHSGRLGMGINAGSGYAAVPSPTVELSGRALPIAGTQYKMSLWFKPETGNDSAMPYFILGKGWWAAASGSFVPHETRYVTLDPTCWTVEETAADGWKKCSAWFTMPEYDTGVQLSMQFISNGGASDGYYDDFSLTKDTDSDVKAFDAEAKEIKTAKVGDTLSIRKHVLSNKTAAEGGKKVAILLAAYDNDGVLKCVDVKTVEVAVNKGVQKTAISSGHKGEGDKGSAYNTYVTDAGDVTLTYTVPEVTAGCTIKAFCLNGVSSLKLEGNICEVQVAAE